MEQVSHELIVGLVGHLGVDYDFSAVLNHLKSHVATEDRKENDCIVVCFLGGSSFFGMTCGR